MTLIPCTYIAPSIPKPWQALTLWLASEYTNPAKRKEMVFGFILRLEKLRHWLTSLCTTPSDREQVSGLSPGMFLLSGSTLALPNKSFILRLVSQHSDCTCFAGFIHPLSSQAKCAEDKTVSLTLVQRERGSGKKELPSWFCLQIYVKPSFTMASCFMWDCGQANIPSAEPLSSLPQAKTAAAYPSTSQGFVWDPNQISVVLRHVQCFRKELQSIRHEENNASHMYWNLDACLCFHCFYERQLKDPIGEMLVQLLVMLFVIYANVLERRGKLNDFEMHTLANESSNWLGNSEWQQASSVCHFPGCTVFLKSSKALQKGAHLF